MTDFLTKLLASNASLDTLLLVMLLVFLVRMQRQIDRLEIVVTAVLRRGYRVMANAEGIDIPPSPIPPSGSFPTAAEGMP